MIAWVQFGTRIRSLVTNCHTMALCFFNRHPLFPQLEDDSINTIEFLDASRGLVWLVEQFGLGFQPVKDDLLGNIQKLLDKYNENTHEHKCLMKMILLEKRAGGGYATESLLWLRRGLSFMENFLSIFLEKERNGEHHENMVPILGNAYENSLKPHHGWPSRILFKLLLTQCPKRSQFLSIVGYSEIDDRQRFISLLDNYLKSLQQNLEMLVVFCRNNDINPHY